MLKNFPTIRLVLAGAFLFSLLFWKEGLGLNFLLYDLFIVAALLVLYPDARKSPAVRSLLLMQTVCAGMVVLLHTDLSIFALITLLSLFAAFAAYAHRSILFAGGSLLFNSFEVVATIVRDLRKLRKARQQKRAGKWLKLWLLPLLTALLFFLLYVGSNSVLASFTGEFFTWIGHLLDPIFSSSLIGRFFFLLLGLYLTGWLLLRSKSGTIAGKDRQARNQLERRRTLPLLPRPNSQPGAVRPVNGSSPVLALKKEYIMGVISLALLNGLLLVENGIDIAYVWFNYGSTRGLNFSDEVHEGTELLIFSILCAMLVLLLFFRGNLNFYKGNRLLKSLSYAWIIQNGILVCSVLIRDLYYIQHFGLYYKRIGVLFFLAMVLGGLVTMFIKIRSRKTAYYLVRVNAWIMVVLIVAGSLVSWDEMIVQYNIRHTDPAWIDWNYLLQLSDKTIPELTRDSAIAKFRQSMARTDYEYTRMDLPFYLNDLAHCREEFIRRQQTETWLSWNWADHKLYQALSQPPLLSKQ